jgi:broad specificity phosphatase PhoE
MARLYLVRHAQASAGFGEDPDPGLDQTGREQAEEMAAKLGSLGPLPMITSPLRRARETVAALERRWNTMAIADPSVAEIPSPTEDLAERQAWLRQAMTGTWADLGPRYTSWRTMMTEQLLRITEDTVIVTHFVAINAAIGVATGQDLVMCRRVANASVTVFDAEHKTLRLVEGGEEGTIVVH